MTTSSTNGRKQSRPMDRISSPAVDAVLAATHPSPEAGGPCATCAFRNGTEANLTEHTQILVRACVEGMRLFHCHEKAGLCKGYIAAANRRGAPTASEMENEVRIFGTIVEIICAEMRKIEEPHIRKYQTRATIGLDPVFFDTQTS